MNGLLIAVEGIDGSGKTTFIDRFHNLLSENNYRVHKVNENSFSPLKKIMIQMISKEDKKIKYDEYAHLFLSLAQYLILLKSEVTSLLEDGYIIIWDRYYYSSIAYSASLGINYDWLLSFWDLLHIPDYVIYCDKSPLEAWNRKKGKVDNLELGFGNDSTLKDHFISFQESVHKNYHKIRKVDRAKWIFTNESTDLDYLMNHILINFSQPLDVSKK